MVIKVGCNGVFGGSYKLLELPRRWRSRRAVLWKHPEKNDEIVSMLQYSIITKQHCESIKIENCFLRIKSHRGIRYVLGSWNFGFQEVWKQDIEPYLATKDKTITTWR